MSGYDVATGPGSWDRPRPPVRRRRWPIVLLIMVVLLGAIFVVADRIAVSIAQDRVATRLAGQRPFEGTPKVTIHGFPFLTQAAGGRYSEIEVSGTGQELAGMTGATVDAQLHGAHIPLSGVGGGVKTVPVDQVDVSITIALTQVARAAGVPGLTLTSRNGSVVATAPIDLDGLGHVTLSATVHLAITGGALDGSLTNLRAASATLPSGLVAAAEQLLRIHVVLPNLGFDSAVATARTSGTDVVFTGSARNVTLH